MLHHRVFHWSQEEIETIICIRWVVLLILSGPCINMLTENSFYETGNRTQGSVTRCLSYKESQMFLKLPKSTHISSYLHLTFFKISPKSHQSFWGTFIGKFVVKSFQKSPKIVTLTQGASEIRQM